VRDVRSSSNRRPLARLAALALILLFTGFVVREATLGGCAVDRVVPSGHLPDAIQ
jgi:hypothetical protein